MRNPVQGNGQLGRNTISPAKDPVPVLLPFTTKLTSSTGAGVDPVLVDTLWLGGQGPREESTVGKTHPPYAKEFRAEAVRLVRESGKSLAAIAKDLGVSEPSLRAWRKQADLDSGKRSDGLTTEERDEVRRLRRQVRVLLAAITGLSGEEMTEPSLDGWSVKDHLAHLAL